MNFANDFDQNTGIFIAFSLGIIQSYKLVYLNGNNAAEGENNIKNANSYPMN